MKKWYQSKTLWFNIISLVALIIQYIIDNQMFPDYVKWELLGILIINFLLRIITNTGIGTPTPPAGPPSEGA